MAFRTRYVLDMTAREALHLIELRSGSQGHSSYRIVAQEMFNQIKAVHPNVADAMAFVDESRPAALRSAVDRLTKEEQLEMLELFPADLQSEAA